MKQSLSMLAVFLVALFFLVGGQVLWAQEVPTVSSVVVTEPVSILDPVPLSAVSDSKVLALMGSTSLPASSAILASLAADSNEKILERLDRIAGLLWHIDQYFWKKDPLK